MIKPYTPHMLAAIEAARAGQTPFGAALAMGDQLYVTAANQTGELYDPTAHAGVVAIRKLGEHLRKTDLSGFTLYSTCEPCPMCMSAVILAGIETVFYGCGIHEVSGHIKQIDLRAEEPNASMFGKVLIKGDVCLAECRELLQFFSG